MNGVAPGPIWTPLIASSFDPKKVSEHGSDVPLKRAGEPVEIAPSYLFLCQQRCLLYDRSVPASKWRRNY